MEDILQTYSEQLEKLEQIARRFFERKFASAKDLWKIEIDLINFQADLQKLIAEENDEQKKLREGIKRLASHCTNGWKQDIQYTQSKLSQLDDKVELHRRVYKTSLRLGDALAWSFFNHDERNIIPLTRNSPTPSIPTGVGLKGMLAIAEVLLSSGIGFPVLHDMTKMLRVGDITFISNDQKPITIEVKTHKVKEEQNTMLLNIEVHTLIGTKQWDKIQVNLQKNFMQESKQFIEEPLVQYNKPEQRLFRQIERMKETKMLQEAKDNSLTEIGKHKHLVRSINLTDKSYHWDIVREIVAEAKTSGFSCRSTDDGIVYVALYKDQPIWHILSKDKNQNILSKIPAALTSSPMFYTDTSKNSLHFSTTWSNVCGEVPSHILPVFLYQLPFEMILDMIWDRLEIMTFVNLGRIVEAINNAGLNARLPKNEKEFSEMFIPTYTTTNTSDGTEVNIQLSGMHYFAHRILYEFITLQTFIDFLLIMTEAAVKNVKGNTATDLQGK